MSIYKHLRTVRGSVTYKSRCSRYLTDLICDRGGFQQIFVGFLFILKEK